MQELSNAFVQEAPDVLTHVRGKPVRGKKLLGVLNNRSKFATSIIETSPLSGTPLSPPNNSGTLYLTKAFAAPGAMYRAEWKSTSAFCLTYFQWGNSAWARELPEE